jgi:hypothetical protein
MSYPEYSVFVDKSKPYCQKNFANRRKNGIIIKNDPGGRREAGGGKGGGQAA